MQIFLAQLRQILQCENLLRTKTKTWPNSPCSLGERGGLKAPLAPAWTEAGRTKVGLWVHWKLPQVQCPTSHLSIYQRAGNG